jgi:hypothetical protein
MIFEKHPIEGENARYRIVPQADSDAKEQSDPNLNDVLILMTNDCPINKSCLAIDGNNMTCGCDHLGPYPFGRNDNKILESLLCRRSGRKRTFRVSLLKVKQCPLYKKACITKDSVCDHLKTVNTPWDHSKPHASVVCTLM